MARDTMVRMPILFICSQESDYLQDLTYAGLSEILPEGSVIEYPHHWQFHKQRKFFWSRRLEYPRNLGLISREGSSPSCNHSSLEKIHQSLKKNEFQLVVLGSCKPDALLTLNSLLETIQAPWIFVDGGDRKEIGGDFERLGGKESLTLFQSICRNQKPALIFKRELPLQSSQEDIFLLFPLPFSLQVSRVSVLPPNDHKKYQVLFWAVESSQTRKTAFRLLKGCYDCDQNGSISGQKFRKYSLKGEDYFEALNQSQIALSLGGEGFDTLRYWEIPASGTLLLSESPRIQIPNNFVSGQNAVFCKNDLSDLTALIDYYITHKNEASEIAREGQKHLLQYHTHIHRAESIRDILSSQLDIRIS
ncbi:MAG: glycosyltransferase family 1 protein [Elusimicrobia bacterium]|nr:glycosyltransferase family 1 protein [Elusimicrobiota bacterium]